MGSVLGFFGIVISIFAIGCAAPRTQVVASRQHETIDQHLFKEGDRVWVTYQDKIDTVATKSGFVLDSDNDSVRLDIGWKRVVDIEYRRIQTLSLPEQNHSYVGLSVGRLPVLVPHPHELPDLVHLTGVGVSFRHWTYLNKSFEGNFSMGKGRRFSSWISLSGNGHFYTTIMPRTYFLFGMGLGWAKPTEKSDYYYELYFPRIGLGTTKPMSKYFNVRAEANFSYILAHLLYSVLIIGKPDAEVLTLAGIRVYFEHNIH